MHIPYLGRIATLATFLLGMLSLEACQQVETPKEIASVEPSLPASIDYNWHVRPILSNNCFRCHGNDAAKRQAGLRLDIQANAYGAIPEDKDKRAIVPGSPFDSEAMVRILSDDPDKRMPPLDSHKTLTAREKAILFTWIKQGAKYQQHWAYVAPKLVPPAKSVFDKQAVNDIDRYVYARLQKEGLNPAPEADRETLINRLALDLTGLPPTLQQVDDFVADKSPAAYESLVDRLLSSGEYGERMAMYWLDVARYGESDGYLDDNYGRLLYPWRDWVIEAFNKNMPYDKFATWQLAGDLLPEATREQRLATAFARVGKRSTEAGIIDEEYRVEYRNERSELVGKAFLGLTVGCAKCHDHKYDAISQADYYSLAGFFNSVDERGYYAQPYERTVGPTLPWPGPNAKIAWDRATGDVVAKQIAYVAARKWAISPATARAEAIVNQTSGLVAKAMIDEIDASTVVYYPLDETHKGPLAPIMITTGGGGGGGGGARRVGATLPQGEIEGVPSDALAPVLVANKPAVAKQAGAGSPSAGTSLRGIAPAPGQAAAVAGAVGAGKTSKRVTPAPGQAGNTGGQSSAAAAPRKVLPDTLTAENISFSASGRVGDPDIALQKAKMIPGAKGQGFLIDDNMGFLGPRLEVGRFERTEPFSLDLYIKPRVGKPYSGAGIVYYQDQKTGYGVLSDDGHVRFDLVHASPYNQISVLTKAQVPAGKWTHVAVSYDGSSKAAGVQIYLDGQLAPLDIASDHLSKTALPNGRYGLVILGGGYWGLTFGKKWRAEEFNGGGIDELRVITRAITAGEAAVLHDAQAAAASPDLARTSFIEREIEKDPNVIAAAADLKKARDRENEIATKVRDVMVLGDQIKVRPTYILQGGLYDKPLAEVKPQGLQQVFAWRAELPRNRLGMSKWLFDKSNPLTSRVFVNRLWQMHFGTGIVETVEDFGTQGAIPTNPDLLDWLALEFVRSGWDIKHLHKLIVMSATYRQSSKATAESLAKDSRNLLLAHGPRYRLPAEAIRDNALFASGLLVDKKGGDAVFPYQPEGVWSAGAGANSYPTSVPDDDNHRRSMYTFYKRASPYPSLAVFDMADRSVSTVARRTSNTPLQALVLLNDVQYVEAYRKLAERAMLSTEDSGLQVEMVFRLATRRHPVPAEAVALRDYYDAERLRFASAPEAAEKLLTHGVSPIDPRVDRAQLAALTMVASVVMNSPDAYTLR